MSAVTAAPAGAGLEASLLVAHAAGDTARLVDLYAEAARLAEAAGDGVGAGFYRTHAYVYALESGHPSATALHAMLKADGREE